jgi:hypothetical protein
MVSRRNGPPRPATPKVAGKGWRACGEKLMTLLLGESCVSKCTAEDRQGRTGRCCRLIFAQNRTHAGGELQLVYPLSAVQTA